MSTLENMSTDEVVKHLLEDMEMLRRGSEWWADEDSIEAHCALISELHRRLEGVE